MTLKIDEIFNILSPKPALLHYSVNRCLLEFCRYSYNRNSQNPINIVIHKSHF